jgi:hypothetical protein
MDYTEDTCQNDLANYLNLHITPAVAKGDMRIRDFPPSEIEVGGETKVIYNPETLDLRLRMNS